MRTSVIHCISHLTRASIMAPEPPRGNSRVHSGRYLQAPWRFEARPRETSFSKGNQRGDTGGQEMRSGVWQGLRNCVDESRCSCEGCVSRVDSCQQKTGDAEARHTQTCTGMHPPLIEHEGDFCSNGAVARKSREHEGEKVEPVPDEGVLHDTLVQAEAEQTLPVTHHA